MSIHFRPSLLIALLAVAAVPWSAAQEPEKPVAEFEGLVEVSEVLLDVIATDKKGNVIRGLGPDDFIVKEDGHEVQLTSANFYTTRYDSPAAGEPAGTAEPGVEGGGFVEVPSSRYFIIFFQDQKRNATPRNRLLQQQIEAGRRLHDWVRDDMGPSDWIAVVSYDVKLVVHQDFTQDVGCLLKAIIEASRGEIPEEMSRSQMHRAAAGTKPSLWRGLPDPVDLAKDTRRIYDAIRLVAEATRPIVGRKNLLFFGIGFGEIESPGYARGDLRYYPQMEQALNDNNVAIYPIDITPNEFEHVQSHFLNQLAADTGGYYHENIVSFKTPLERISQENLGYYALSYRTEHPAGESGYRHVTVKSKDKKVKVRTRKGYRYGV